VQTSREAIDRDRATELRLLLGDEFD